MLLLQSRNKLNVGADFLLEPAPLFNNFFICALIAGKSWKHMTLKRNECVIILILLMSVKECSETEEKNNLKFFKEIEYFK